MLHIISNPDIASATRLWILIRFQQSGFHDREFVERTIGWFAKKLNVSSSTVQKWQRILELNGYLEIIEQKLSSKNNRPNRYRACLPKSVKSLLQKRKCRKRVDIEYTSNSHSDHTLITAQRTEQTEHIENHNRKEEEEQSGQESKEGTTPCLNQTKEKNISKNDKKALSARLNTLSVIFKQKTPWLVELLPTFSIEQQGTTLWITGVNQFAKKAILEKKEDILSDLNNNGHKLNRIKFNKDQGLISELNKSKNHTPPGQKQNKNKDRKIYGHTQHRILKRVMSTTISGQPIPESDTVRISCEIAYAITLGSLSSHSIPKGINIALKLLRENRWKTPSGYTQTGYRK